MEFVPEKQTKWLILRSFQFQLIVSIRFRKTVSASDQEPACSHLYLQFLLLLVNLCDPLLEHWRRWQEPQWAHLQFYKAGLTKEEKLKRQTVDCFVLKCETIHQKIFPSSYTQFDMKKLHHQQLHLNYLLTLRAAALCVWLRPRGGRTVTSSHSGDPWWLQPLLPLAPGALHVMLGHLWRPKHGT